MIFQFGRTPKRGVKSRVMFSSAFHVVCLEFTFFAISLKFEQNVNDIKYINNKTFIFSIILYYLLYYY